MTPISKSVGAPRILGGITIPHPVGQPNEPQHKEDAIREQLISKALVQLTTMPE